MLKPKVCPLRTSNSIGGWSTRYQLPWQAIKACDVGLLHADGGISCRPHPAAATQLVVTVSISGSIRMRISVRIHALFLVAVCCVTSCCIAVCGRTMASDASTTIRLLQCLAGLHNISSGFQTFDDEPAGFFNASRIDFNESYQHQRPASNGSGADVWNADAGGTKWLRECIKSKLVPTICVVGILGNLLTLVVLACQQLRAGAAAERKVNIWLQALAVSDLLLCVALLPHGVMAYGDRLVYTSLSFQLLYKAYGAAVINNFILTSTWITVAMSFSRYMAVCHPLGTYQNVHLSVDSNSGICRHGGTRVKAGVIFIACFLFNLPRFFINRVESHNCSLAPGTQQKVFALNFDSAYSSEFRTVYVWIYFVVAVVIPLMILAFCNVRLVNALYQSQKLRRQHSAGSSDGNQTPQTAGTIVTMTMIAIVLMYAVLVAPGEILTCITKHLLTRYDE